ncbi:MAG: ATP-binding protein, partial [Pseudomonadota bacterium]|nr:ATP-binding protein [Pseudomonadota bacterium]
QKIPLYDWLEKIINKFIIENNLSDKSIILNGNGSTSACGDPQQLQHVILNLLSNARRYAKTDINPFVAITINDNEPGTMTSSISISDNGPGIAEDIRDNIFEPFFTTASTGNGLGLYIARKICLSNHGYLDYIYNKSGSSFFRLTLASNRTCQSNSGDNKQD